MLACAVCGLMGTGENGWAYLAMTLVMSALPLVMIGGMTWWVYRRHFVDINTPKNEERR
jgi:hypothetical protein